MRKGRNKVTLHISEENMKGAVGICYILDSVEKGRARLSELDDKQRELYYRYLPIWNRVRERMQPLIDAVRNSERLGQDYNIVIY